MGIYLRWECVTENLSELPLFLLMLLDASGWFPHNLILFLAVWTFSWSQENAFDVVLKKPYPGVGVTTEGSFLAPGGCVVWAKRSLKDRCMHPAENAKKQLRAAAFMKPFVYPAENARKVASSCLHDTMIGRNFEQLFSTSTASTLMFWGKLRSDIYTNWFVCIADEEPAGTKHLGVC